MERVDYQSQRPPCPVCGSPGDVLSVQDLVDMMDLMQADAMQRAQAQNRMPGPRRPQRDWDAGDLVPDSGSMEQDIAGAVMGIAGRFAAQAIGRRVKRSVEDRMSALGANLSAQADQAQRERHAVAERYPELHGCTRDQVVFLTGGGGTLPLSEVSGQITMAKADDIVRRLRGY
jgi:hypothetical protein